MYLGKKCRKNFKIVLDRNGTTWYPNLAVGRQQRNKLKKIKKLLTNGTACANIYKLSARTTTQSFENRTLNSMRNPEDSFKKAVWF